MNIDKSSIRIKDIARLAGVSEGTVDRVLHKRGDVSAKSLEAVNKVLQDINYTPNILARSLASKKSYRYVYLIPHTKKGEYWSAVQKGFEKASVEFAGYNVSFEQLSFDQFDVQSYNQALTQLLSNLPEAVFIAPIFKDETLLLTEKLEAANIPYSFLDSMIPEANFLTYYGQDSTLSGYIAAKFLVDGLVAGDRILVVRNKRRGAMSNQTRNRFTGFMNYLREMQLESAIQRIEINLQDDNEELNKATLQSILTENPSIKAAITFNSRVHRMASKFQSLGVSSIRLIGYDLLDENIDYLKKGIVSLLIGQRPENQSYYSARDMCRKLIFKQELTQINYMPIDLLIKENIDAYMHFQE